MCFDPVMPARLDRIEIRDFDDPRIADYQNLKDATLAIRKGRFIVEGRGNLSVLLERSPLRPESILLSERTDRAISGRLEALAPCCPVYVAPQSVLDQVVGFSIHRGCLAACLRPKPLAPLSLAKSLLSRGASPRLIVLEGIRNHDNVGGIFRNAMAFGAGGVVLCPESCDPLYRKAIRTSMGGALCVPFGRATDGSEVLRGLREMGYKLFALDPAEDGVDLDRLDTVAREDAQGAVALLLGTEGEGLSAEALDVADRRVRITMEQGVDSLNVAVASGIALHSLRALAVKGQSELSSVP